MHEAGDVLAGVGPRLRALRHERSVTLSELAVASGISPSTLSRLETGRLRPTLEQLLPLARFYGATLDELVDAPATGDPRVHLRPVRRFGMIFLPLTRRPGGIGVFKVILPVRRSSGTGRAPQLRTHEGYEWVYVMSGRARLVLGSQDFTLQPGEAAEFDTRVPHSLSNAADTSSELLMMMGPQGERAHVAVRGPSHEH